MGLGYFKIFPSGNKFMEYYSKYKMAILDRKKMLKAKYYLSIGIDI